MTIIIIIIIDSIVYIKLIDMKQPITSSVNAANWHERNAWLGLKSHPRETVLEPADQLYKHKPENYEWKTLRL